MSDKQSLWDELRLLVIGMFLWMTMELAPKKHPDGKIIIVGIGVIFSSLKFDMERRHPELFDHAKEPKTD